MANTRTRIDRHQTEQGAQRMRQLPPSRSRRARWGSAQVEGGGRNVAPAVSSIGWPPKRSSRPEPIWQTACRTGPIRPFGDPRRALGHVVGEVVAVRHHDLPAGLRRGVDHLARLGRRHRHRLLDQHVGAASERGQGVGVMGHVRRGDHHAVRPHPVEQRLRILVAVGMAKRSCTRRSSSGAVAADTDDLDVVAAPFQIRNVKLGRPPAGPRAPRCAPSPPSSSPVAAMFCCIAAHRIRGRHAADRLLAPGRPRDQLVWPITMR